jgi:hypothetical protein
MLCEVPEQVRIDLADDAVAVDLDDRGLVLRAQDCRCRREQQDADKKRTEFPHDSGNLPSGPAAGDDVIAYAVFEAALSHILAT